eukprot:jgi/Ulvmu1/1282/UM011_0006.1
MFGPRHSLLSCILYRKGRRQRSSAMASVDEVVLALDWTPNINHVGFFVAYARGFFEEAGVKVVFTSPHSDDYKATPAQKVATGAAHVAICPSESVISHACQANAGKGPRLKAVAAVLCKDTSAIVTLADSGITRPRELSGKRYASYGARYEGRIVQQLIRADGGDGEYVEDAAEGMLGLWGSLLAGKADATWVFMAWEGVLADRKGVKLNAFRLDDYKIPYGYSPVMAVDEASLPEVQPALTKFMAAAACGWNAFVADPEGSAREATQAMNKLFPDLKEAVDEAVMVDAAAAVRDSVLPASGAWGSMEAARWDAFLDWLAEAGLLTAKMQSRTPSDANATPSLDRLRSGDVGEAIPRASISAASLFTNDLLPQASS